MRILERLASTGLRAKRSAILRVATSCPDSPEVLAGAAAALIRTCEDVPPLVPLKDLCQRALAIDPGHGLATELLAFAHHIENNFALAEILLRGVLARDPTRSAASLLAEVLACDGRRAEAIEVLERYHALDVHGFEDEIRELREENSCQRPS